MLEIGLFVIGVMGEDCPQVFTLKIGGKLQTCFLPTPVMFENEQVGEILLKSVYLYKTFRVA